MALLVMMRLLIIFLLLTFFTLPLFGQKQANIWYFGRGAGIDFNHTPPQPLTDGQTNQYEGTASIADKEGKLLLYTDGVTLYNRDHQVIAEGLYGYFSSTQSALIVPFPADSNLFYIFTADSWHLLDTPFFNRGLNYSLVDLRLNQGKGGLLVKNQSLHAPTTEKLTATFAADCHGIWVITHPYGKDAFYVYKVDENGLNPVPVVSKAGRQVKELFAARGQLKVSPDGKKLACATAGGGPSDVDMAAGSLEIFDFDTKTGIVSNPNMISGTLEAGNVDKYFHGVEFSPDGSKLYACFESLPVYQYEVYNLSNPPVEIGKRGGTMQLAPDGRIYITNGLIDSFSLSVINLPNQKGVACNLEANQFSLKGREPNLSLPNFIQSYFLTELKADFKTENACENEPLAFSAWANTDLTEWQWNFGDPSSGENNTSFEASPRHTYSKAGEYSVQLIAATCYLSDTITKTIVISKDPLIDFALDTLAACFDELPVILTVPEYAATTYKWNTGSESNRIEATESGWYTLTASNNCNTRSDSLYVQITSQATAYLPNDTVVCDGNFALLDAKNEGSFYEWNTGETTRTIQVSAPGTYWVEISNRCSSIIDTTELIFIPEEEGAFTTNVFTPNGDGVNDIFVNYVRSAPNYRMQIANRWGKIVFESRKPEEFWDGTMHGNRLESGVYFYLIETQDCRGNPLQIKGTVSLLR